MLLRALGGLGLVVYLAVSFTPLPHVLARWTRTEARIERADAIVVLGAYVDGNGVLADSSLRRAVRGIALERRSLAPVIVFSGGLGDGVVSEAEVRAALARDLGVPAAHILTDAEARTTREEAVRLPRLLSSIGARRILLVTDPQHMARAMALFRRAGLEVLPAPAEGPEDSLGLTQQVVQEWLARLYYRVAGYL